jgi:membrane protein implicated in regulation of membrane protease activity
MPWFWLGIAVIMTIVEGMTMGLTTVWLAIAALVCMILAFFIPSVTLQIIVFLILSIAMLVFTRPFAVKKLKLGRERTNADRLVGMKGIVQKQVKWDEPGQVKVGGQIWTARPEAAECVFELDQEVRILRIEGVTLIVASPDKE